MFGREPRIDDRIFVGKLHHADRCIILIGNVGIGVYMIEDLAVESFLKFDHPLIDVINAIFIIRKQVRIHKSVQPSELSCNIQLEIDVDTFLFQLRKEIVKTF